MTASHSIPADQAVGPYHPALPIPAADEPLPLHFPQPVQPALTLYQVPVPGAVEVALPDGTTAWATPVPARLTPQPVADRPATPSWELAKAVSLVAGSITLLTLGGATALRIAAPALGEAVDLLNMIWKVTLTLAVILLGVGLVIRARHRAASESTTDDLSDQPLVIAPVITTGGTRLFGRSGDVNVQIGDHQRNKQ